MRSANPLLLVAATLALTGSARAVDWNDYRLGEFYPVDQVDDPTVREASAAVVSFRGATGFVVSPDGYILTNHHVWESFGDSGTVTLARGDEGHGGRLQVELVSKSRRYDVAVYKTTADRRLPHIPLRTTPPVIGESVFVIGHPKSHPMRVSFGRVLAKGLEISGRPSVEYSAQTWWGSSGSPVLDKQGRAFAIHWGWDADGQSNGRLTGVPFHRMVGSVPEVARLSKSRPMLRTCRSKNTWRMTTTLLERDAGKNAEGRSLDRLQVRVTTDKQACRAYLKDVTYHLHPTFSRPVVKGQRRRPGHPITLSAWGYFDARAKLQLAGSPPLDIRGRVHWR